MTTFSRLAPWLAGAGVVATLATVLALPLRAPARTGAALAGDPVRSGQVPSAAKLALAADLAPARAAAEAALPVPLPGAWFAAANGDRVQAVLREGDTLWSATTGGVVRWSLATGAFRQYLAPQDGLPGGDVRALARDRDGVLWAATSRGLARFDARAETWRAVATPTELGSAVTALAAPAAGGLWVGFEQTWAAQAPGPAGLPGAFSGGGLARLNPVTGRWDAVWQAEAAEAGGWRGLPSNNVTALAVTADGLVWVGTRPFHSWRTDGCPTPPCDGSWAREGGGLAALAPDTGAWARWSDTDGTCLSDTIAGLAGDSVGRAWAATRGDGLQVFRAGQGTVACGTGHTVYKRTSGGQPLPGTKVWSVAVASDGRVYVGVGAERGQGIAVLDHHDTFDDAGADDTWRLVGLDGVAGAVDPVVSALAVADGEIVAGTFDSRDDRGADGFGIKVRGAGGAWRTLATAASGLPGNRIAAVAVDPVRGHVWFGTTGRGVARWDGQGWRAWRAYGRERIGATLAVTSAQRAAELLLAIDLASYMAAFPGDRALARLGWEDPVLYTLYSPTAAPEGVRVRVFPPPEPSYPAGGPVHTVARGPAGDLVTALAVGADGILWLGARSGLARRANPDFGETDCDDQPATASPDCRWDGGLSALDGDAWATWAPEVDGLPTREVQAVGLDRRGQVWVGTGGALGEAGSGAAVLDPASGGWTLHNRATRGEGFGYDNVSGVAVDPVTGQVWLASQGKPACATPGKGGDCPVIAGAVSRWDGRAWQAWARRASPPSPGLADQGAMTTLLYDRGRGEVWAGGWEGESSFHWNDGTGVTARLDACPRDCAPTAWTGARWPDEGAVYAAAAAADGRLWAGGHRSGRGVVPPVGGVRVLADGAWTVHNTTVAPLPSDAITALAAAGAAMWVGTWDRGAVQWVPPTLDRRAYLPAARR